MAPYKKATWIPIGREQAAASVKYSQGLRPPGHVTSFIKIESQASKGIADSAENATVFVVMRGEVTVVINSSQFIATRGDIVYVPPDNTFDIINTGQDEAELFNFQYVVPDTSTAPASATSSGPDQVQSVARYKKAAWINIGREQEGVAVASVKYSKALRPPGHVAAFFRIEGQASKGLTNSANSNMVFVVMRGEITVMINSLQFTATMGDIVYVAPYKNYTLFNMGQEEAELFNLQYRNKFKSN